jgi:hypothetical protein
MRMSWQQGEGEGMQVDGRGSSHVSAASRVSHTYLAELLGTDGQLATHGVFHVADMRVGGPKSQGLAPPYGLDVSL